MTETVMDRYVQLADAAVHDSSALDELLTLFAPDATLRLGPEPVRGGAAVDAFYRAHFAAFADSRHFWHTTVLDDGRLRVEWVVAARMTDGQVVAAGGVEHAELDESGLITDLSNEYTRPPG